MGYVRLFYDTLVALISGILLRLFKIARRSALIIYLERTESRSPLSFFFFSKDLTLLNVLYVVLLLAS